MANPYTIEKMQIAAQVHLPNQTAEPLRLFLDPNPMNPTGFERPSSIFADTGPFVPMLNAKDEIVFVRRESIMALTVSTASELDEEEELRGGYAAEQAKAAEIEVTLEDGTKLQGEVRYILPEAKSRLQDFIDLDVHAIVLRRGDQVDVVNKSKVMQVKPIREREGVR